MTDFPNFSESIFIKTRRQFHSVAEVIGKFREMLVKPIAKNDNLWLRVADEGFCTPPMPEFRELEIGCNIQKLVVEVANNENKYDSIGFIGKTQRSLCEELNEVMIKFGVEKIIDSDNFDSAKPYNVSENDANEFLVQFTNYNALLSAFHKRISNGVKSQICLWPHHFDNAFKWFSGKKIDDQDEQMGIGVSNGDETYELPYIYMTFWPPLRKTNTLDIAEGAILHDTDWTGLVLPYESVAEKQGIEEQKRIIENFFDVSFAAVQRAFSKR